MSVAGNDSSHAERMVQPSGFAAPGLQDGLASTELRYLVLAAQREGSRQLNRYLSPLELTASQAEIILVLSEFGPVTLKDLGGLIVCESGSPSRIVDALVKRGLVAKNTDPSDRRAVTLNLTRSGAALVPQLRDYDTALNAASVDRFTPEQLESLVSALRTFLTGTTSEGVLDRRFAAQRSPFGVALGSQPVGEVDQPADKAVALKSPEDSGPTAAHAKTASEPAEYPQDLIDAVTEQVLARLRSAQSSS